MKTRNTFARVSATLAISLFSSIAFAQVSQVPDRATLAGTEFIDWQNQGGPDVGQPTGYFSWFTAGSATTQNGVTVGVTSELGNAMAVLQEPSPFWGRSTNFSAGDFYLQTEGRDASGNPINSHNAIIFTFDDPVGPEICGFGTQMVPVFDVGFRARIEAFDAGNVSMGSFDVNGSIGDPSAAFLGVSSIDGMTGFGDPISAVTVAIEDEGSFFAQSWYAINQVDLVTCPEQPPEVPVVSCDGFASPMAKGPVKVKKNRALPLKMELFDDTGFELTDMDLVAAPVVTVLFGSANPGDGTDVSDDAVAAGHGTDGNEFKFTLDDIWQYNLKTKNYTASGEYYISVVSGDEEEYVIDPACVASFIVK